MNEHISGFLGCYHGSTRTTYGYLIRDIEDEFAQYLPDGLARALVDGLPTAVLLPAINQWLDSLRLRELAPSYTRQRLAVASSFCRYLVVVGIRESNPFTFVRPPRLDLEAQHTPAYSPEQLRQFFEAIERVEDPRMRYRDLAIFGLMARSGMRRNEVRTLLLEAIEGDFDLARPLGKGGKTRVVAIAPVVAEQIRQYLSLDRRTSRAGLIFLSIKGHRPLTNAQITRLGSTYARQAGLPPGSCHIHRRSFATIADAQGVPLTSLQRALGHTDPKMTARYIKTKVSKVNADF